MTGWISLHRSIENHWMFQEKRTFSKFEAWIDLLMMVNHKDNKVLLGNELITVKRGQKITSIRQLCDRWSWSNNKVKNFLNLLEADGMLIVKSDTKKTVVTIAKYDLYQNEDLQKRHQSDTKASHLHHDSDTNASRTHTNNNDNNVNNELIMNNNDNKADQSVGVVFDKFQELGFGTINGFTAEQINEHLQTFEPEVVIKALEVASNNNKRNLSYANGILKNWKQRNIITLEDVKAAEQQREVEQASGYNKFTMNRATETRPKWLDEDKEQKRANVQELKSVTEDKELSDLINKFRES